MTQVTTRPMTYVAFSPAIKSLGRSKSILSYQTQLKLFSFTILNLLKPSCSPRNEAQKEILTKNMATSGISSQTKIADIL